MLFYSEADPRSVCYPIGIVGVFALPRASSLHLLKARQVGLCKVAGSNLLYSVL